MISIERLKELNDLEYVIFNYIDSHRGKIVHMKLKEVADAIHVSPSAVTRCIKKLGYDGFAEFKTEMKLHNEKKYVSRERTLQYLLDYFHKVDNQEFIAEIQQAVELLMSCEEIIFFGVGISGALAKTGAYLFNRKGIKAFGMDDFSMRVENIYDHKTAAIILTVSGETDEVNRQLVAMKKSGMKTLVITNTASSPSAKLAHQAICYYVPSERNEFYYSSATQVPVMYILELLSDEIEKMLIQ